MRLDSAWIRQSLGLGPSGASAIEYTGVATDSREIGEGGLFVALRGERVDGADFLPQVAEAGAAGALVRAGSERDDLDLEYFTVADPLDALGRLAAARRAETTARVVAVTGSSGKTTVKEMIASALSAGGRVYRTAGNLNSQVGLPLSILRAPVDADVWVLEIGASEPGEIARLTAIAAPDDVVVTTVGPAHLEAFGTEARVLDEKLDLVRGASAAGTVVVGELPPVLPATARAIRADVVVAGILEGADHRPDEWEVGAETVRFTREGATVTVAAGGEHHLRDALMATAVARARGLTMEDAARGLEEYRPVGLRGAVRHVGGLTILADCYNANPESFRAAIAQCRDLYADRRRAAFVGSMLELGAHEATAHSEVASELVDAGFEPIAATGRFAAAFEGAPGVVVREEPDEAWDEFADALDGDEVVLVKASRGARLERVLDWLDERFGALNGSTIGGGR